MPPLRRDFTNRQELATYVKSEMPFLVGDQPSPTAGGRRAADELLAEVDPVTYARNRNFLQGRVSRLSPYIRHGVLSLGEVRRHALQRTGNGRLAYKFVSELGWRDYWQRVYRSIGEGVWRDRYVPVRKWRVAAELTELPDDVREGRTGLACMDSFRDDLVTTGYLHNHSRMWMASWLIHWRRVRWQAAARWFLQHLLDGDVASNNLSFQWVGGQFSHRPYLFNRENLEKYTGGAFCATCPSAGKCPFDATYEELDGQLFMPGGE